MSKLALGFVMKKSINRGVTRTIFFVIDMNDNNDKEYSLFQTETNHLLKYPFYVSYLTLALLTFGK